ncbi:MAG: hypothetical protein IT204_24710 [Fimbriimonadaceae bacterium]|nr:hypothetical protein [Fimbriimonadaceae bacterium]
MGRYRQYLSILLCCLLSPALPAAPLVRVLVDPLSDGPAAALAARQIATWPGAGGRLEVQPDPWQPRAAGSAAAALVVVLRESFEWRSHIPAASGATLEGSDPAQQALLRDVASDLNRLVPQPERRWQVGALAAGERERLRAAAGGAAVLVVTTAATRDPDNRIYWRVRQFRHAVYGLLSRLGVLAATASPEQCLPTDPAQRRQRALGAIYDGPGASSSIGRDPYWLTRSVSHLPWLELHLCGPEDLQAGALSQFDAVIFGGGLASEQAKALGAAGLQRVRDYVRGGGGLVGVCAGAFLASCNRESFLGVINAKMPVGSGGAVVPLRFTADGEQVLGCAGRHDTTYHGGPLAMEPAGVAALPPFRTLATYGADVSDKTRTNTRAAVALGQYGAGRVIVFSPHCERTPASQVAWWRAIAAVSRSDLSGVVLPTLPAVQP